MPPARYLTALLITLTIEVPVYAVVLRVLLERTVPAGLAGGTSVNLISHPLAFLVLAPLAYPLLGALPSLVALELTVWLLEAMLIRCWLRGEATVALLASLLANSLSLLVGLVVLTVPR